MTGKLKLTMVLLCIALLSPDGWLWGQEADVAGQLAQMRKELARQVEQLKSQQTQIETQQKRIDQMEKTHGQLQSVNDRLDNFAEKLGKEPEPTDFNVFWKDGLRFQTVDKKFKLKIGGRLMCDGAWMSQDSGISTAIGDLEDGVEFRRVRLGVSGTVYENVDFKLEFDFADGDADLKDAWLGYKDLPLGYLKAGHFKEPMGLDELTGPNYATFIELALPVDTFAPSHNVGVGLSSNAFDKRLTWACGGFRETNGYGAASADGGYNVTGRVTVLPWCPDEEEKLLHLGISVSFRNPEDPISFSARPEIHLAPIFVNTGNFTADDLWTAGLESALVLGPFSLQGELMWTNVDAAATGDADFYGYYIQASYFLTGERRPYKRSSGVFSRVRPKRNLGDENGWGAWEVAARYSFIDLSDGGINGGELDDVTVGLNWYLNPNTRVMVNYVHANLDGVGDADLFGMRLQIVF